MSERIRSCLRSRMQGGPGLLSLLLLAAVPFAQGASAAENDNPLEEIVVYAKFQRSLADGITQKRNADNQVDAIGLAEIGVLPFRSIADVVSQLPGVGGARNDDGYLSQLSVRGTTDLTLGTLNGREQVTVASNRNVEYQLYPPNVMNSVQVYKSNKAELTEGGLSGVINMQTIRPMDFDERQIVVNGEVLTAQISDDVFNAPDQGYQGSVMYIDQLNEGFGIVLSYSYARDIIGVQGDTNPFDWRPFDGGFGAQLDVDGDGTEGEEVITDGFNYRDNGGEELRNSFFTALQWQGDNLEVNFDLLLSNRDQDQRHNGMNFIGLTRNGSSLTNAQYLTRGGFDEVFAGTISIPGTNASGFGSGGSFSYNQQQDVEQDVQSGGLNVEWTNDAWTVSGDLSFSRAEHNYMTRDSTVHLASTGGGFGGPTFTINFNALGRNPTVSAVENLTDPTIWVPRQHESVADRYEDQLVVFKWDAERVLDVGGPMLAFDSVEFGVRYSDREKNFMQLGNRWNGTVIPDVDEELGAPLPLTADFVDHISRPPNGPAFIVWDVDAIRDQRFRDGTLQADATNPTLSANTLLQNSGSIEEDTWAGYVQLNFQGELGSIPYTGNFGLRYVNTSSESPGYTTVDQANVPVSTINPGNSYTEFLTSLNVAFDLRDDVKLRIGFAEVMNRAPLNSLRSSQTLYISQPISTGNAGNPDLLPTTAQQTTVSLEWYPTDYSSFIAAAHYSALDTFVGTEFQTIVVITEGITDGFGNVTPAGPVDVQLTTTGNGDGGYISGFEFAANTSFGFIADPLDTIGMSLNYANTTSNINPVAQQTITGNIGAGGAALTGLSEDVLNLNMWWASNNIEARVGIDHRSEYIEPNSFGNFLNVDARTLVQAQIAYDFSEDLRVSLFALNLGDEQRRKYTAGYTDRTEFNVRYGETYGVRLFWRL